MIIGFLGKGGSGKSTVSTQMALYLNSLNRYKVFAIDADHNMDLSFNLSAGDLPEINYLGDSLADFQAAVGLTADQKYSEAFLYQIDKRFQLEPMSPMVGKYSTKLDSGIILMAAGPQNDSVMYGKSCSHILTTPLKILLPLIELSQNEFVVVDEKAGADGVTTGIVTGIDVGAIVCEPAVHSIKTALQIAELMEFYQTPYVFVGNKISNREDNDFIEKELGVTPTTYLMQSSGVKRSPSELVLEWQDEMSEIVKVARTLNKNDRLERTKEKFKRNAEFI